MSYDLILKNGKIIDGTGNPWYRADIGITDGKICAVSKKSLKAGERIIDVKSQMVTPGFINLHGHFDRLLHIDGVVQQSLMQGVTVECTGSCGLGVHTMNKIFASHIQGFTPSTLVDWLSLEDWRRRLEQKGLGLNIAPFIGFGVVRTSVMGLEGEGGERYRCSQDELNEMKTLVAEGMEEGAYGFTVGLIYQVQRNSATEEIIALAKVAAEHGGVFMSHARGGPNSVSEFIRICEQTPIPGCLSHATMAANRRDLAQFQDARDRGVEILFDMYPWIHGSGKNLGFWLFGHQLMKKRDPFAWRFWNIGDLDDPLFKETAKRLKDDDEWKKVKADIIERMNILEKENNERRTVLESIDHDIIAPPLMDLQERVGIVFSPSHPEFEGDDVNMPADLGDVKEALGVEDIWDAARALFVADEGKTLVVNKSPKHKGRREVHVIESYLLPWAIVGSDASHMITHPREWGTWPKILQRYVRELGVLRLEDMIKKMTSLPANFLGLSDRGVIKEGNWADIVVFDPKHVMNRASYQEPRNYPTGIPYVIVNGELVVVEEVYTDALPGKVLRKS